MNYIYIYSTVSVSLTARERGAYIRVEKRVTNLGGLYSRELIHGGGGAYLRNFTVLRYSKENNYLEVSFLAKL